MEFEVLDLSDPDKCGQWNAFVQWYPARGHHHHTDYLKAILSAYPHHQHLSLIARRHNDIVGVLPLIGMKSPVFGKNLVSIPYYNYGGALAIGEEVELALYQKAKSLATLHGYTKLQIRADKPMPDVLVAEKWESLTHKVNMHLTLPENMHDVGHGNAKKRAKLRSQAGLAARRAIDMNIEIKQRFGGQELLDDFYQVFSRHMRDLGTPVFGKDFFRAVFAHTHSELTVTYWDDEPVGCGWLFRHGGGRFSIPWASTLKRMNAMSLNSYMYHQILLHCHAQKSDPTDEIIFDFGRSTVDAGTYHFKAQWGATPAPCFWYEWDEKSAGRLPASSNGDGKDSTEHGGVMGLMVKIWQKMPLALTNRLGPHLIKNIPA